MSKEGRKRVSLQLILGLVLLLGLGGLDSLHHAEARLLNVGLGLLLGGHELLVLVLELLDLRFEGLLGLLEKLGLLGNGGIQIISAHLHELVDLGLLVIVAEVDVRGRAHGLEVLGGELLELGEPAAAAVVLEGARVSVLEGGETLDSVRIAKGLSGGSAVNIGNEGIGSEVLFHELVPIRFHLLAVASPRRKEFNENGLARGLLVPVVGCQFDGIGHRHEGEQQGKHLVLSSQKREAEGDRTN
jgi:hypothetical protein